MATSARRRNSTCRGAAGRTTAATCGRSSRRQTRQHRARSSRACDEIDAVCTSGGRALLEDIAISVPGPATPCTSTAAADDTFSGQYGPDVLHGGLGADTFVFAAGDGADTITDFTPEKGDRIDLSAFAGLGGFASLTRTADGTATVLDLRAHGGGTVRAGRHRGGGPVGSGLPVAVEA